MTIIDRLWQQVENRVFISRSDFERNLDGWKIEPVELDGQVAGAILTCGPELHFASFGHGHPITRQMIHDYAQPIIDEYGYIRTKTPKDDERQGRLNKLIGFTVEREDEFFVYYRAERLRLRGNVCPS